MTIRCTVCGHEDLCLAPHLLEAHGLSEGEYDGVTVDPAVEEAFTAYTAGLQRTSVAEVPRVTTRFAGIEFPVNLNVPASAARPLPAGYQVPQHGKLAEDVRRVAVRLAAGNNKPIWVWGPPGTGKDAVFDAISSLTRRPTLVFNIAPDVDVRAWIAVRAFDANGTSWEEGLLLKALRDGYMAPNGTRVPYLIVLSDLDRATRSQMEPLRAIIDSLGGRIVGPDGRSHAVLQGTVVVATANTSGGGDTSGRYSSSPVDTSVLDRFTFKVVFHGMDAKDERPILQAKYPALCARFPDLLTVSMKFISAIRDAIAKEEVFIDFGHRSVCNLFDAMSAEAECAPTESMSKILTAGLEDLLAGCPNQDTAEQVKRLIDPHIKGGLIAKPKAP